MEKSGKKAPSLLKTHIISMKMNGTKYSSKWDSSTFLIIALVSACCLAEWFLTEGLWPLVISVVMLVFVIVVFASVSYRIVGRNLIVYSFFRTILYPIDAIEEIKPTKSVLSAPAISLTHRLAIKFNDPNILKSSTLLIISPVRQKEFITELLSINPKITLIP